MRLDLPWQVLLLLGQGLHPLCSESRHPRLDSKMSIPFLPISVGGPAPLVHVELRGGGGLFLRSSPWASTAKAWGFMGASLVAQLVKNPPAMQKPRFLGQENLLEKG